MQPVKMGVIGIGGMGGSHLNGMLKNENIQVTAVADINEELVKSRSREIGIAGYKSAAEMIASADIEAVLIAVPHPFHASQTLAAAERGLHVLCEKPIAVRIDEADQMIDAMKKAGKLFGIMFQQRLIPLHRRVKEIIDEGTLGNIYEIHMIATAWYRRQSYYNSGGWRGTWKGEGGGVLANQSPHNQDFLVWLAGLPSSVSATVTTRIHNIEVENTAFATFSYPNGAIGSFRTTTTDPMGQDKLEIIAEKGRLLLENNRLYIMRYSRPLYEHIHDLDPEAPPIKGEWEEIIVDPFEGSLHQGVIEQFVRAIRYGEPLIATGEDGRNALELANAMHLSGYRKKTVFLPLDRHEVKVFYQGMIE